MNNIPFLDLRTQHEALVPELMQKFEAIVRSAGFIGGPEVEAFEAEFPEFCGVEHGAGVGSGTDALRFAFLALGAQPGDEIITVPQTFIATAEAIVQTGATIKFVDVDPQTHTMDPSLVEAAITPKTVGIVPVHLYGRPADMDPILQVARRHALWVVEDAAQAHGATYRDRWVGSFGDAACFSFYPGKNLGACGEAGAVVSKDAAVIDRVKMIRDHGQARKYLHSVVGYNGRLDALQAAALRIKLRHLRDWTEGRRRVARWYNELFEGVGDVLPPVEPAYANSVFHLYTIQVENRDELREELAAGGVGVGMHYPVPLHLQEAFRDLGYGRGAFPASEAIASRTLSLPMYPELSREAVETVVSRIEESLAALVRAA